MQHDPDEKVEVILTMTHKQRIPFSFTQGSLDVSSANETLDFLFSNCLEQKYDGDDEDDFKEEPAVSDLEPHFEVLRQIRTIINIYLTAELKEVPKKSKRVRAQR